MSTIAAETGAWTFDGNLRDADTALVVIGTQTGVRGIADDATDRPNHDAALRTVTTQGGVFGAFLAGRPA